VSSALTAVKFLDERTLRKGYRQSRQAKVGVILGADDDDDYFGDKICGEAGGYGLPYVRQVNVICPKQT